MSENFLLLSVAGMATLYGIARILGNVRIARHRAAASKAGGTKL